MNSEEDLIPVRMLHSFVYCPRSCYIEWIQGDFVDNKFTLEGTKIHKNVDKKSGDIPDDEDEEFKVRSMKLSSENLGIVAVVDMVEGEGNFATPVEYKRGKIPNVKERAREPGMVQLCAQGLLLRERGFRSDYGFLYFAESRTRVKIDFDEALISKTLETISSMNKMRETNEIPAPLVSSPKCPACSLVGVCLPDETNFFIEKSVKKTTEISSTKSAETRLLYSPRDDGVSIYISEWGCSLHKDGERVVIKKDNEVLQEVPINKISSVSIYGECYITSAVLRELMEKDITVCYFSFGGWFYGYSSGIVHKNVGLRLDQYDVYSDDARCLELAKGFVTGKIKNCRTLVRRNDSNVPQEILDALAQSIKSVEGAKSVDELLGIEGNAAKLYFSRFDSLLKNNADFSFDGRNRRPPMDPVNAALSYAYGLLTKECFVRALSVGFDPYIGFYHRHKYGKPALALDLMEEFRPIVADSVVITLFNNGELSKDDFIIKKTGVSFKPDSKKKLIRAYEKRMNTEIIHPFFAYKVSYRRAIEVQARLLVRCISGEIDEYPYFYVR